MLARQKLDGEHVSGAVPAKKKPFIKPPSILLSAADANVSATPKYFFGAVA
jgi:hypothetical protein